VHLLLKLVHFDVDDFVWFSGGAEDRRDGQGIDVAGELDSAAYLRGRGHCLLHRRHGSAEGEAGGGGETALEEAASAQHRARPGSYGFFAKEESINSGSICLFCNVAAKKDTSLILLRQDEGVRIWCPDLGLREIE
jgi:hypothetical protein